MNIMDRDIRVKIIFNQRGRFEVIDKADKKAIEDLCFKNKGRIGYLDICIGIPLEEEEKLEKERNNDQENV